MTISLVEFCAYEYRPRDDDDEDRTFKNGVELIVNGAIGSLSYELEYDSASIEEALADVDWSQFYDATQRDSIEQRVVLAFDVEWVPDWEGYCDEATIKYLGRCDTHKWTAVGLQVTK